MKKLILFPLVFLLFCSTPTSAQENPVYAETVSWWRGVIQELQPYREQLQNLYADTEARSQFERGKIEGEFRQRLVREYPGSSFFASMGGTWQVNGHTRIGFDRNWQIHKLIQKFGSLTKIYDFRQNIFIVQEAVVVKEVVAFSCGVLFEQKSILGRLLEIQGDHCGSAPVSAVA